MKKNIRLGNFAGQTSKKKAFGLIFGPILFFTMFLIPFPNIAVSDESSPQLDTNGLTPVILPQIALGTMLWMVIWWVTECVPLGFTSLLAPFIFIITGILTVDQALPKFADPIIWIFISGFVLAAAFKKSGLDKRIAFNLALFYKGNNPKIAIFFIACLPVFLLSMTGSITASTTIVFPFVLAYLNTLKTSYVNPRQSNNYKSHGNSDSAGEESIKTPNGDSDISKYTEASFLSLGQAATAGAMLLLISTAPNLIAKATVEDFAPGTTISFTDWFVIGLPHAVIGLLISWNIIFLLLRPKINFLSKVRDQFKNGLGKAGKITMEEKTVLSILFLAMSLWIIPSVLRSFFPEDGNGDVNGAGSDTLNYLSNLVIGTMRDIPESIPALLIILLIGLVKIKRDRTKDMEQDVEYTDVENEEKHIQKSWQPILSWNEILKSIDWNIIFLFGGGLVLGLGIEASGLATLLGDIISNNLGDLSTEWGIFAISAIMAFLMSYAASNTASAVIVCPIAASLAIGAGFNPIPPIIAAGLGASISSAIPSTTPPMAIIYASKSITILNMFKTGIISDILRLTALIILGPFLISIIYGG